MRESAVSKYVEMRKEEIEARERNLYLYCNAQSNGPLLFDPFSYGSGPLLNIFSFLFRVGVCRFTLSYFFSISLECHLAPSNNRYMYIIFS